MKKTYIKPAIDVVEFEIEPILTVVSGYGDMDTAISGETVLGSAESSADSYESVYDESVGGKVILEETDPPVEP